MMGRGDAYCFSCKFWQRGAEEEEYGNCRRYAPKPTHFELLDEGREEQVWAALWPRTFEEEWCGEYLENRS